MFPKYNNYIKDPETWDPYTKILVPTSLLGIPNLTPGEVRLGNKNSELSAVLSYALYRKAGLLYEDVYDETVTKRWGIQLRVGSHVLSFAVLVPVVSAGMFFNLILDFLIVLIFFQRGMITRMKLFRQ